MIIDFMIQDWDSMDPNLWGAAWHYQLWWYKVVQFYGAIDHESLWCNSPISKHVGSLTHLGLGTEEH